MDLRTHGVPSTMLANFDDQSSDNSENEVKKDIEEGNLGLTAVSQQLEDMPLNQNAVETLIRNDISPPPGDPKVENSARLRRYRHNIE